MAGKKEKQGVCVFVLAHTCMRLSIEIYMCVLNYNDMYIHCISQLCVLQNIRPTSDENIPSDKNDSDDNEKDGGRLGRGILQSKSVAGIVICKV